MVESEKAGLDVISVSLIDYIEKAKKDGALPEPTRWHKFDVNEVIDRLKDPSLCYIQRADLLSYEYPAFYHLLRQSQGASLEEITE